MFYIEKISLFCLLFFVLFIALFGPLGNSRLWDFDLERLLVGVEHCAMQGIFISEDVWNAFDQDDKFFRELAGNAFCAPVVLLIVLAIFTVIGETTAMRKMSKYVHPDDGPTAHASSSTESSAPSLRRLGACANFADLLAEK